ncbi:hypothetical protein R3P38DRAFT_2804115 [Favolaschia claudopus]|uniref:Uncharacterized protein n=1 Tax=Favolaschia claudopus TaxID=2862362 RepID=A0AAV9ZRT8_9AGAR
MCLGWPEGRKGPKRRKWWYRRGLMVRANVTRWQRENEGGVGRIVLMRLGDASEGYGAAEGPGEAKTGEYVEIDGESLCNASKGAKAEKWPWKGKVSDPQRDTPLHANGVCYEHENAGGPRRIGVEAMRDASNASGGVKGRGWGGMTWRAKIDIAGERGGLETGDCRERPPKRRNALRGRRRRAGRTSSGEAVKTWEHNKAGCRMRWAIKNVGGGVGPNYQPSREPEIVDAAPFRTLVPSRQQTAKKMRSIQSAVIENEEEKAYSRPDDDTYLPNLARLNRPGE